LVSQRDIIEVFFELPQGLLRHPVIVLSNNEAIKMEGYFVGVMLTSQYFDDEFTFPIEDFMLTKPLTNKSQVRLHLIGWFSVESVVKNSHYNHKIKIDYFKQLTNQINNSTFSTE
jgi:hypothetical protein